MSALIDTLHTRHALRLVDSDNIDAFLSPAAGEAAHALLFFAGDPDKRVEANDVAVVLPELLAAFAPRIRAGVVARYAEAALAPRFQVQVYPSLVLVRGLVSLSVMPRIRGWADYISAIDTLLTAATPRLQPSPPPRVEFRYVKNGSAA